MDNDCTYFTGLLWRLSELVYTNKVVSRHSRCSKNIPYYYWVNVYWLTLGQAHPPGTGHFFSYELYHFILKSCEYQGLAYSTSILPTISNVSVYIKLHREQILRWILVYRKSVLTMRSIAVGNEGHRIELRKGLKCNAVTMKDSIYSMRISEMTFRNILPWGKPSGSSYSYVNQ